MWLAHASENLWFIRVHPRSKNYKYCVSKSRSINRTKRKWFLDESEQKDMKNVIQYKLNIVLTSLICKSIWTNDHKLYSTNKKWTESGSGVGNRWQ